MRGDTRLRREFARLTNVGEALRNEAQQSAQSHSRDARGNGYFSERETILATATFEELGDFHEGVFRFGGKFKSQSAGCEAPETRGSDPASDRRH